MLHEKHYANNGILSQVSITSDHTDRGITSGSVDDTLGKNGTHAGQYFLMLVLDHLAIELLDRGDFWLLGLSNLDEHHGKSNESTLSHEIDLIIRQWSQEFHGFIDASASATDTNCHSGTISQVWVVRLS